LLSAQDKKMDECHWRASKAAVKREKVRGGGGVKHITVVTEEKIMPRAIYIYICNIKSFSSFVNGMSKNGIMIITKEKRKRNDSQ